MIELKQVPKAFVCKAWADGAHKLSEACDASGGEITGDQLKLILMRGERFLLSLVRDGEVVGWGVVRVDDLPNVRVLMATDLYAPGADYPEFFQALQGLAAENGCTKIRCAADAVRARLYRMGCGFKPVYQILEVDVCDN